MKTFHRYFHFEIILIASCLGLGCGTTSQPAIEGNEPQPIQPSNNDANNSQNTTPSTPGEEESEEETNSNNTNETPPTASPFEITAITSGPLTTYFAKKTSAFGIEIVATSGCPDSKVLHAATILAEYLDNDEDGTVDDPLVLQALLQQNATILMFATEQDMENSEIHDNESLLDSMIGQGLHAEETNPSFGFDAALEEVLHLISSVGYESVYPALSSEPGSDMANAMDIARGGHFTSIPNSYPALAWYSYDDETCDYRCMAVEYFYWALTSQLGGQSQRCTEISDEWKPCTPELFASTDSVMHSLITNPGYKLPTLLPDGNYAGNPQ